MARGLWKGSIKFGWLTIPVSLVTAERPREEVELELIDRRDQAPVGYQKINKKTGRVVENADVVKGLKLPNGKYAVFEAEELSHLRIKGNANIELKQFVFRDEVNPLFFKKPFYLEPLPGGEKAYLLLREVLHRTEKYAVGRIVLHSKEQLVLIGDCDEALVLYTLHFSDEIRKVSTLKLPKLRAKPARLKARDVLMAEELANELTRAWRPESFKDMSLKGLKAEARKRRRRALSGETGWENLSSSTPPLPAPSAVFDLRPLLAKTSRPKFAGRTLKNGRR